MNFCYNRHPDEKNLGKERYIPKSGNGLMPEIEYAASTA